MRALLLFLVACSSTDRATAPRVDIRTQSGGYSATLVIDGKDQIATAKVPTDLGMAVGLRLPAVHRELTICGDPAIPLAELQTFAKALPRPGDYVVCLPDRKNCPGSCP